MQPQSAPPEPPHEPRYLFVLRREALQDSLNGLLNVCLDAAVVRLTLPTMKTSAQVLNNQGNALHRRKNRRHHRFVCFVPAAFAGLGQLND
jgi:hypothetical protein